MTSLEASVLIVDDDVELARSAGDYARVQGFATTLAHALEQCGRRCGATVGAISCCWTKISRTAPGST